jgi:hypothetical protein
VKIMDRLRTHFCDAVKVQKESVTVDAGMLRISVRYSINSSARRSLGAFGQGGVRPQRRNHGDGPWRAGTSKEAR